MAEIKPLRAWKYNHQLSENIDQLTSPLFDVVSEKQRESLYQNVYNSIHLSVPKSESNAAIDAAQKLKKWKDEGIIEQDELPGIYVYYQYFTLAGSHKEYCRKGFICNIKAYDWDENVILRHENTIPNSVNDRIALLQETQLNVSPTHGLYTDSEFILEQYMDESMKCPLFETEDYQGVRDVLSVIHDAEVIKQFLKVLDDKKIILADGHHRYEGSLRYRKMMMAENENHDGTEAYNFHLMFLTNTEADDLRILPTHRLIHTLKDFDESIILKKLEPYFDIKLIHDAYTTHEVILGKEQTFGLLFNENAYKISLKPGLTPSITWDFPDMIKQLDLTILHYFIIEKALGISGKEQRGSENLIFDRSFGDCLTKVVTGEAQMAIITNDILMEDVKKVCYSGFTLPQKSTYFYPKVICGFLFSSIKPNEFQSPNYSCF